MDVHGLLTCLGLGGIVKDRVKFVTYTVMGVWFNPVTSTFDFILGLAPWDRETRATKGTIAQSPHEAA